MEKVRKKLEDNLELDYNDKFQILQFIINADKKSKELEEKSKELEKREKVCFEMLKKASVNEDAKTSSFNKKSETHFIAWFIIFAINLLVIFYFFGNRIG